MLRPMFITSDEMLIEINGLEIYNDRTIRDGAHLVGRLWQGIEQDDSGYPK